MPVSPALAESLAADVVEMYAEAERALLARIAKSLAKGLDAPGWAEKKLAEVQFLRHQTEKLVADLGDRAAAQVAVSLAEAYNRGGASAAADLAALLKVGLEEASAPILGLPSVERLVAETMRSLIAANARMTVATVQAFRDIVTETSSQVLIGTQTRRQAAQAALNRFAAKGITGFVDRSGRGWNLASYVEMAMRTGCGKAAVQGHIDRLQQYGLNLVIVSDAPKECPLCRPWEGKVLSIGGVPVEMPGTDYLDPGLTDEWADGETRYFRAIDDLEAKDAEWAASLSEAEQQAVRQWTGGKWSGMGSRIADGTLTDADRALLSAMGRAPLMDGVTTWRGIPSRGFIQAEMDAEVWAQRLKSGEQFHLSAGPAASSIDPMVVDQFGDVVFEIRGRSGRFINAASVSDDEFEVLFPPGAKFRVVGISEETFQGDYDEYVKKVIKLIEVP
jgi:hypothetical protein